MTDDISPYYRLSTRQVESLANDLKSYDMRTRIQAAGYISKFVLEPAESLIKYISEGDCIQVLTVR